MGKQLYGKGTLIELEKGKKYRIKFSGGKDPQTNKYRQITETFLGTKRQAQLRIEEIRRELASGKRPNADKVSFSEWCEEYLSMREGMGKYRTNTLRKDRSHSKHLINGLGGYRLADITPAAINALYVSMRENGVGEQTLLECHRLLKRTLEYAVKNDVLVKNPAASAETPQTPKANRTALSSADASRLGAIVASGTPTANKCAVFLGLALGARLGEVLGLEWKHMVLDGERPYAHIIQQHTRNNERTALKTDKDSNPVGRVVPLDASTISMLKTWKAEQRKQLNALGIEQGISTPVITNEVGSWVGHSNFERWWRNWSVENGFGHWVGDDGRRIVTLTIGDDPTPFEDCTIEWKDSEGWRCDENGRRYSRSYKRPKIKRHYDGLVYHELRHSHFTKRLADGMDIPTAQALGGWSTPAMLMRHYVHATPESVWESVGFMDRLAIAK